MKRLYIFTLATLVFSSCKEIKKAEIADNKIHRTLAINYVDTIHLAKGTFYSQLISNGKLRALQKSDLRFPIGGIVNNLSVRNGQIILEGSVIATLESDEQALRLRQAKSRLAKAKIELQNALLGFGYINFDSTSVKPEHFETAKVKSGYETALEDVISAQITLDKCVLKAPFDGKIANLKTKRWENPKGEFFCTIIDDQSFDIEFAILESELKNIKEGLPVKVATFTDPELKYNGIITSVNQMVDNKGQILVTANIPNPGDLIDGMNVKVYVESAIENKLIVPKRAVVIRDNLEVLFRMSPEGKSIWTYIHIESANAESYAITANTTRGANLSAGDIVIIDGHLNLADNVDIQIKTNKN